MEDAEFESNQGDRFIPQFFFINNCFELIATKLIPYAFYLIFESLPFINMLSS